MIRKGIAPACHRFWEGIDTASAFYGNRVCSEEEFQCFVGAIQEVVNRLYYEGGFLLDQNNMRLPLDQVTVTSMSREGRSTVVIRTKNGQEVKFPSAKTIEVANI